MTISVLCGLLRESRVDSEEFYELGNFSDNEVIFSIALREITNGEMDAGLLRIYALRDHILRTHELKSREWLLPQIEHVIHRLGYHKTR